MKRDLFEKLSAWRSSPTRKPLVVCGARQVGKTWLMKEFGKSFRDTVYISFDNNRLARGIFDGDFDIKRILIALQALAGHPVDPANTLIILDEIQEAPKALTCLKYFCEDARAYHVIAAGSLLGLSAHEGSGFPVGKVDLVDLHPLSFTEFLRASPDAALVDLLADGDWPLVTSFRMKFVEELRRYLFVGGMPEAVAAFAARSDFAEVREIQRKMLESFVFDFSKHAPPALLPRIRMVWDSVPVQLARENRKFLYGSVREGSRAKDFELAIEWLRDAGLVHRVDRVAKPALPLGAYATSGFKLFGVDVGLLGAMSGLEARTIIDGDAVFTEFKGALTEQYVLQQLLAESHVRPFYWSAERSTAEVDFLFQADGALVPVEAKAGENLQAKSLAVFREKFAPRISVRTSLADYRHESWLVNLPLYALSRLMGECAAAEPR